MLNSGDEITVSKMDAAKRQLRTAIRLWFQDGDPVSIHTLLCASHEIIHRLFRNKGFRNLIFDSETIADEFRGEWAKALKKAANFFKHASQGAEESIVFYPDTNDLIPLFLIQALCEMGEVLGLEESTYVRWMWTHHPQLFKSQGNPPPIDLVENIKAISKADFFDSCEFLFTNNEFPTVPLVGRDG